MVKCSTRSSARPASWRWLALVAVLVVLGTSCGSDDASEDGATADPEAASERSHDEAIEEDEEHDGGSAPDRRTTTTTRPPTTTTTTTAPPTTTTPPTTTAPPTTAPPPPTEPPAPAVRNLRTFTDGSELCVALLELFPLEDGSSLRTWAPGSAAAARMTEGGPHSGLGLFDDGRVLVQISGGGGHLVVDVRDGSAEDIAPAEVDAILAAHPVSDVAGFDIYPFRRDVASYDEVRCT